MFGKELGIEEFNIQQPKIILFLDKIQNLMPLLCLGIHQYTSAKMLDKEVKSVMPPIPIKSFRVTNLITEYGSIPEITIESDIKVSITPHLFSANKADEDTIPTIADGHPKLIAKLIFATFSGGP